MTMPRDHYLHWLRDAHAMEEQAQSLYSAEISRVESYPEFRSVLQESLERSRHQGAELETLLERIGHDRSVVKETLGKFVAFGQSLSGLFTGDEVVKAALAINTFVQMKVCSYHALRAAAERLGETEAASIYERFCDEEAALLERLHDLLPELVTAYLDREQRKETVAG